MKPAPFDYASVGSVPETVDYLTQSHGTAKPVAGNQSLGPMLNLRLVRTGALIDVSMLPELRRSEERNDSVFLGAAITHAEIEDGEVPDPTNGWIRDAAAHIAYRAVRNKGTIGGSLAHADPAADWVIVLTGLCASVLIGDTSSPRRVLMEDFITGPFTTTLKDGELLLGVDIPKPSPDAKWGYWKFSRQVGEFAKASACVLIDPQKNHPRCAVGALGGKPLVLENPEALINGTLKPSEALQTALPNRRIDELALHIAALERALLKSRGKDVL
mgnify:CR=1 FL=1